MWYTTWIEIDIEGKLEIYKTEKRVFLNDLKNGTYAQIINKK